MTKNAQFARTITEKKNHFDSLFSVTKTYIYIYTYIYTGIYIYTCATYSPYYFKNLDPSLILLIRKTHRNKKL